MVKPQVGREGISGLGTLLSGAYRTAAGSKGSVPAQYPLLDSPPLASPDAKGIGILLESKAGSSPAIGAFRGYRVVQLKPAPSMRKNAILPISCLLARLTIGWSLTCASGR